MSPYQMLSQPFAPHPPGEKPAKKRTAAPKLTDPQARYLLTKHATGQPPAMSNRGKVMDRLIALGMLDEQAQVTPAGAAWCLDNHLSRQW